MERTKVMLGSSVGGPLAILGCASVTVLVSGVAALLWRQFIWEQRSTILPDTPAQKMDD
ncbi:hypothetical protein BZA77DRAFT_348264 [Pyronema omphalodes]|nr:hypothetical protein BZA77DRAFT_348264 [Pyronema omphalodes]